MTSSGSLRSVRRAVEAAWVRPFALLVLLVPLSELVVRAFSIPPYLISSPREVIHASRSLKMMAHPTFVDLSQRIRAHFFARGHLD